MIKTVFTLTDGRTIEGKGKLKDYDLEANMIRIDKRAVINRKYLMSVEEIEEVEEAEEEVKRVCFYCRRAEMSGDALWCARKQCYVMEGESCKEWE